MMGNNLGSWSFVPKFSYWPKPCNIVSSVLTRPTQFYFPYLF
jgi:hypothetical protein